MKYELIPLKEQHQKSFYGNGIVSVDENGKQTLFSYGTRIMEKTADGYEIKCWCPLEYILEEIDAYKPKNKNFVAWYDRPERGGYAYKCWAEKNAGIIDEELDIYITHEDEIDITAMLKYIQDCDRVFLPEYEGEDD